VTHLLDSSAVIAYYFDEPGADQVAFLLEDNRNPPAVSCITEIEFWSRLRSLGDESSFESNWKEIAEIVSIEPLTNAAATRAREIRQACQERLPTVDTLIAATASVRDITLVHRDPHFQSIPSRFLKQLYIGQ
jgi:predicted nucleic acid-binding protein